MRFGSVCSGIEAASVAWQPLGWSAAWLAEIEPFPCAVLAHHYPTVPNLGDMTRLTKRILLGEAEAPDVLCGGTPCQAFSVAGLRKSLDDDRGNLSLIFCEIADAIDHVRARAGKPPAFVFWENVPGVLSTKDNAFGCFLAGLAGADDPLDPPGGRWKNAGCVLGPRRAIAWRTLDAQYFGLAQRRRRVFVVASARDRFDPAQVLFEWDGLRRDTAPSREAGQDASKCLTTGTGSRYDWETEDILPVTHSLRGEGLDASEDGTGRGTPLVPCVAGTLKANNGGGGWSNSADHAAAGYMVPVAFDTTQVTSPANYSNPQPSDPCHPLAAGAHAPAVAFQSSQSGLRLGDTHATLDANNGPRRHNGALVGMQVRRLTPIECERLQGFPDGYTAIPWRGKPADQCPDGPRYKALGNSWAVPVARWIGARIQKTTELLEAS